MWRSIGYHIKNIITIIIISLMFLLIIYFIKGIYPFGDKLVIYRDATQGLPEYAYLWDVLHGNDSPFFSWRFAGGINMTGLASQQSFASLLNVFYFFTDRENIPQFWNILLIIKVICISISMYSYTYGYKIARHYKIIFSVLYGFGSFVLLQYTLGFGLDIAFMFPLLMRGFYKIVNEENARLYILMLALCCIVNIYLSFMICIYLFMASGLWFLLVCKGFRMRKINNLFWGTMISIGLGAVLWLPGLLSIIGSGRVESESGAMSLVLVYCKDVFSLFRDLPREYVYPVLINTGLLFSIIVIGIVRGDKKDGILKYHFCMAILMVVSVIVPGIELLWHGGTRSSWPVRFGFLLIFAFVDMCLYLVENGCLENETYKEAGLEGKNIAGMITAALVAIAVYKSQWVNDKNILYVSVGFISVLFLLYLFILLKAKDSIGQGMLCSLVVFEILFNGFNWISPNWYSDADYQYMETANLVAEQTDEYKNPLERAKDVQQIFGSNYAPMSNLYSVGNWVHIISQSLQTAFAQLGYSTAYTGISDTGGTAFSDALLNIRTAFSEDIELSDALYEQDTSVNAVRYYSNKYVLPIGILINEDIAYTESMFDYQNRIFSEIFDCQSNLIEEHILKKEEKDVTLFAEGEKELYFYSDNRDYWDDAHSLRISVNGEDIKVYDIQNKLNKKYPVTHNNAILDLGTYENEEVQIHFSGFKTYDYSKIHIGMLDIDLMAQKFNEISEKDLVDHVEIGSASLVVECKDVRENGILYLPVSYNGGWKCIVNGKKENVLSIFGGFLGIPIKSGSNRIELRFIPTGLYEGICISIVSFLGCVIWIILKKRKAQYEIIDNAITKVYMVTFVMFFILFFVIPSIGWCFAEFVTRVPGIKDIFEQFKEFIKARYY